MTKKRFILFSLPFHLHPFYKLWENSRSSCIQLQDKKILTGADQVNLYVPYLKGKRIATDGQSHLHCWQNSFSRYVEKTGELRL